MRSNYATCVVFQIQITSSTATHNLQVLSQCSIGSYKVKQLILHEQHTQQLRHSHSSSFASSALFEGVICNSSESTHDTTLHNVMRYQIKQMLHLHSKPTPVWKHLITEKHVPTKGTVCWQKPVVNTITARGLTKPPTHDLLSRSSSTVSSSSSRKHSTQCNTVRKMLSM